MASSLSYCKNKITKINNCSSKIWLRYFWDKREYWNQTNQIPKCTPKFFSRVMTEISRKNYFLCTEFMYECQFKAGNKRI